jgi:hypothetical protein
MESSTEEEEIKENIQREILDFLGKNFFEWISTYLKGTELYACTWTAFFIASYSIDKFVIVSVERYLTHIRRIF